MHADKLLHKLLDKSCAQIDKRLRQTLFSVAKTLVDCKTLSIFGLGRHIERKAKVKNNIKCVDRLYGNPHLQAKKNSIYRGMINYLLGNNKHPLITVDWSGLTHCGKYHFIRASVSSKGRAITLYEEVHSQKKYMNRKILRKFLTMLKELLPEECKPIIMTDAGFRNPWFRLVQSVGWDFIGRVRHLTYFQFAGEKCWLPVKTLHEQATLKAQYIGEINLAKSETLTCAAYIIRLKKKHRVNKNLAGKKIQSSVSKKHAKREKEPWVIVTSLSQEEYKAAEIIGAYKKRMQIEEAFRDIKNTRNGFSLRHSRTYKPERLAIALLIGALATFVLWLFGLAAKHKNLHYSFQANTEKRWDVLSVVTIGWQVVKRRITFTLKELMNALYKMRLSTLWRNELC